MLLEGRGSHPPNCYPIGYKTDCSNLPPLARDKRRRFGRYATAVTSDHPLPPLGGMLPCFWIYAIPFMRYGVAGIRFAPWPKIIPPMGPAKGQSPLATTVTKVLRTVVKEEGEWKHKRVGFQFTGWLNFMLAVLGWNIFRTFGKSTPCLCRYTT